ncbi:major facilitator superfamily domain-containing protein [Syncephalastrum racemosum]|uniref:Lysosomal dipeptide transporter MFSD1 n=1 Tax=Syncephalastrum racemosum TaxID=13706 RepID=A0A1X2HCT0_SYNRA|nr:major facilitator superfamily domain-containing protein [Syncephalastrum racemosum]
MIITPLNHSTREDDERKPLLPSTEAISSSLASGDDDQDDLAIAAEKNPLVDLPWTYKSVALACAIFLAVGSHFAAHTLGAMKYTIKKEFGITNVQYGVLQSSVSIVNTVLPVLGGIFLDAFGTVPGSILTTVLIASGNVLVAASTSSASLPMMITGRILYGIGSGTVVIVQETILSQWFQGRSLAGVIALMMTVSRLASFAAQATVTPIANWTGWYGYGFWFSAILCLFSLAINLIYIVLLRTVTRHNRVTPSKKRRSFSWSKLLYIPHAFWLVAVMEFLLGGSWGCFLHINSEFVKFKYGYDNSHAAATGSVAQILPIFTMPLLGFLVDRYGKRTWMMIGSGATFLGAFLLLQYTDITPIVGMLVFSMSLALGPVGLVSSVPIILPLSLVGTGMGVIKAGTNIGASLFDIMTGMLQDHQADHGYDNVNKFFTVIGMLALFAGVVLYILDHRQGGTLDQSAREAKIAAWSASMTSKTLKFNKANWFYGSVLFSLACISWFLFVRFVIASLA